MCTLGERLKAERSRLSMSQTELAAIGGVGKTTQINYEKGVRSPDASYLAAVAEAGVDVLYVLTGERRAAAIDAPAEIDVGFLAEIAEMLEGIVRQAGKRPPAGPDYVRAVAEVYNFLAQEGTRDAQTTERLLKLVVNR